MRWFGGGKKTVKKRKTFRSIRQIDAWSKKHNDGRFDRKLDEALYYLRRDGEVALEWEEAK